MYGPADEMKQITVSSGTLNLENETFTYNSRLQLTNINAPSVMNWTYTYSATQNNGQITQAQEQVSGETLTYTYDSLKRVLQASDSWPAGGSWSQGYTYDGFGNLTDKIVLSGSAQPLHVTVNPANNQITGYTYDANGNLTAIPSSMTATYDIENRMVSGTDSSGTVTYVYGPDNERVYYTNGTTVFMSMFYGAKGEKLAEAPAFGPPAIYINFAGRVVAKITAATGNGFSVFQDRLGSMQTTFGYQQHWAPYGEHYGTNPSTGDGFATYSEGSTGGLDYARNRYYSPTLGRFSTPDPYRGSATVGIPSSWNRYSYVLGDPINRNDPAGLDDDDDTTKGNIVQPSNGGVDNGAFPEAPVFQTTNVMTVNGDADPVPFNSDAPIPCQDQACELARAMNQTGIQSL